MGSSEYSSGWGVGVASKLNSIVDPALEEVQPFIVAALLVFGAIGGTQAVQGVVNHLGSLIRHGSKRAESILGKLDVTLQDADEEVGTPFVDSFLNLGLGLDMNRTVTGTMDSIRTMKRFIGFCIMLPIAMEGVKLISTLPLARRIPSNFLAGILRLPESMGISFALGMIINQAFEQSVGSEFQEWINVQKRPARLEYPVLMRLVRQHKIPLEEYDAWLNKLGYPEDLQKLLNKLDSTQLTISDIQAAVSAGVLNGSQAKAYLQSLGLSAAKQTLALTGENPRGTYQTIDLPSDIDIAYDIYVTHAETEAGSLYRAEARRAYLDNDITEDQFKHILHLVNIPNESIDLEVQALNFQKTTGRVKLAVGDIRKQYLGGIVGKDQVIQELTNLGYEPVDITNLLTEWTTYIASRKAPLSQAKILEYLMGGVLSKSQAIQELIHLGLPANAAEWLAGHPNAKSKEGGIPLTEANVLTAITDGVLSASDGKAALIQLGLTSTEADIELALAEFNPANTNPTLGQFQVLERSEIHAGYEAGQIGEAELIGLLERTGLATGDAIILMRSWYHEKHGSYPTGDVPAGTATDVP